MEGDILALSDVSKSYSKDKQILKNLTFKQKTGEFLTVVGPSGCGKSTALRCIAALMQPDEGEILHCGKKFNQPPHWLSIVFQDYNRSLFPWLTVRQNVAMGLREKDKKDKKESDEKIRQALIEVHLEHAIDLYPWQMSGGMQQRCALARSVVAQPDLLLLDEPFASVDAQTRIDLQDMVMNICREKSISTLLVTHDIDEAVYMSDKVIVLSTSPATVVEQIEIDLPYPRDQLYTKEIPQFLDLRHHVYKSVRQQVQRT